MNWGQTPLPPNIKSQSIEKLFFNEGFPKYIELLFNYKSIFRHITRRKYLTVPKYQCSRAQKKQSKQPPDA